MIALVVKVLSLFFIAWVALIAVLYITSGALRLLGEVAKYFFTLGYFTRVGVLAVVVGILALGALAS